MNVTVLCTFPDLESNLLQGQFLGLLQQVDSHNVAALSSVFI